ncbi:hypothetical protein B484DRAFT_39623 [Ochromonadaceae sp. CCMP2298]|nr:hypothetical protein B484DRAFT_39623 [Ochromonadaceae sp. CCMP2298]
MHITSRAAGCPRNTKIQTCARAQEQKRQAPSKHPPFTSLSPSPRSDCPPRAPVQDQ